MAKRAFWGRAWRRTAFTFGLAMAPTGAQASEPTPDERELVRVAVAEAARVLSEGDSPACLSALESVREIAWRDVTQGNPWHLMMFWCSFSANGRPQPDVPIERIRSLVQPWQARFASATAPGVRAEAEAEAELSFFYHYWKNLNAFGHREAADGMFFPELRSRVEFAAAEPANAAAQKALLAFAWETTGSWMLHDYTVQFHELFKDRLGTSHSATLVLLRSVAYNERYLGRVQQALEHMQEAVALTDQHHPGNNALRVSMRSERAACLSAVGRLTEALADGLLVRDEVLRREPPSWLALVRSHYNLAETAAEMGDHRAAIAYAEQSIDYARRSANPTMLVEARVPAATRAVSRLMLGEPGAAQELKAALAVTHREMHIGPQAFALVQHAAAAGDSELLSWAADFMRQHIRRVRTPFHADRSVLDLMDAWQLGGAELLAPPVREPLERALAGSLTGRSAGTQALMHFNLARHLAATDPETAIWLHKRAANALQRLRAGLPAGDTELHRAWLSSHEGDLRRFIALLIDQGRLVEAEQAVLLLRDEELHEYTRRSQGRRNGATRALSYTPVEATRDAGMEEVAARVSQAATQADQRADAWRRLVFKDSYRDKQADAELAQFRGEVRELLNASPARRGGASPLRTLSNKALPAGTARLTYFVRADALNIMLQQGRRYRRVSVPIARDELNRRVQALRAVVASPAQDPLPAAAALHATLVAPVKPWLQRAGSRHLQVVPDASLRYVPFAALHDGRRFLAEQFVLSIDLSGSSRREPRGADAEARDKAATEAQRSASMAAKRSDPPTVQSRASAAAQRIASLHTQRDGTAAFGRSVGDEEHSALPGVQRELSAVTRQQGTLALNEAFTADSLRTRLSSRPAVVHIASHFIIDPAGEDKSYLVLGDGRRLSLAQLRQLPWDGVQLALLSACDSALSVDAGHGRELVGFASALLSAGVDNVVASLWRVSDGATAEWMELFYAQQRTGPSGPTVPTNPALLARTQRTWLQAHAGTALAHPHYWAAFQWMSAR